MKRIFIVISALAATLQVSAKKVKFAVNMSGQTVNKTGVHISGDFQVAAGYAADWDPGITVMTKETADTNIYSVVVDIPAFRKYEYLIVNGDQSYEVEVVPEASQVGYDFNTNRWLYVDSLTNDTGFAGAILFGGNAPQGWKLVRFKVDMSKSLPVAAAGVHVAADFSGMNPANTRLYGFGSNVYEVIGYTQGNICQFRFVNGNSAAGYETVPASCNTNSNRTTATDTDVVISTVCFSQCGSCFGVGIAETKTTEPALFPLPFSDQLQVATPLPACLTVLDLSGKQVHTQQSLSSHTTLQLGHLASGIWLLQTATASGTVTTKIVKE